MIMDCILYSRTCVDCGDCDICDIDGMKVCDNCGKCIGSSEEYRTLNVEAFLKSKKDFDKKAEK